MEATSSGIQLSTFSPNSQTSNSNGTRVRAQDESNQIPASSSQQSVPTRERTVTIESNNTQSSENCNSDTDIVNKFLQAENSNQRQRIFYDNFDNFTTTFLTYAAKEEHIEIFKNLVNSLNSNQKEKLLNHRTAMGNTVLSIAVVNQNYQAVQVLLEQNANIEEVNKKGWTILQFAICMENLSILDMLLEKIKEKKNDKLLNHKNSEGQTALSTAILHKKPRAVHALLELNASMEVVNTIGWTPLHFATVGSNSAILQMLLSKIKEKGTLLNQKDSEGKTPLAQATLSNNHEAVKLLLEAGADVKVTDCKGLNLFHHDTPLVIMKMLLDTIDSKQQKLAMLNLRDTAGNTPLAYAAQRGDNKQVKLFLDLGADVSNINSSDNTSLEFATLYKHLETIKLLLKQNKYCQLQLDKKRVEYTALGTAVKLNHIEITTLFLDQFYIPVPKLNDLINMVLNILKGLIDEPEQPHDFVSLVTSSNAKINDWIPMIQLLLNRGANFSTCKPEDGIPFYVVTHILHILKSSKATSLSPDSLETICLRTINQHVEAYEDLNKLPLPKPMHSLLKERLLENPV